MGMPNYGSHKLPADFFVYCTYLAKKFIVLSLAIPRLSLAIQGLSLLVPSQFQDVPGPSCFISNILTVTAN